MSYHLLSIVNQLPKVVNKWISVLSCEKNTFNNEKVICESALKQSEYKSTMKFDQQLFIKRNSTRKIIWLSLRLPKTLRLTLKNSFSNYCKNTTNKI